MNLNLTTALLSVIPPTALSAIALAVSIYTFFTQRREGSYADVDKEYFNILQLAITYPSLRDRKRTSTYDLLPADDSYRIQYESYAFICWNVVETIFDRQADPNSPFGISPTWLPVVIEENRLHYRWFSRNLNLFKARFQEFVMTRINELEIVPGGIADLDIIYPRMLVDFPAEELKSKSQFQQLMENGAYRLYFAQHKTIKRDVAHQAQSDTDSGEAPWAGDGVTDQIFGYAFVFEPTEPRVAWLDYLAIDPRYRNAGFGTQFFKRLCEMMKGNRVGIMLEVEPPTSKDAETLTNQQRRIGFYKRLGAKQLDVEYYFPTETGPYPLTLFFYPIIKMNSISKELISETIRAAYGYIHIGVASRDAILRSFIGKVHDNKL